MKNKLVTLICKHPLLTMGLLGFSFATLACALMTPFGAPTLLIFGAWLAASAVLIAIHTV